MSILAPRTIELLAPARDAECGRAAIDCGADAVYIGAERFGARENAANALDDIAALTDYAHRYWARVYVTLNTLLRDDEMADAVKLAWRLHEAGIDGLIIQDMGLLEQHLPPLPLIASTQVNNMTPEKVAFLQAVGFQRAILARELDIERIRAIRRAAPGFELEFFVHGALCVGHSGQCYLSCARGGRSANRGQCAQPCRLFYELQDPQRKVLARGHLLSLHDLNLTDQLGRLVDAGIRSFKIEGRLKDAAYVANVTAHYRDALDDVLRIKGLPKTSSGTSDPGFVPDINKTFNRGYTQYYVHGNTQPPGCPKTPKMTGERIGRVTGVRKSAFTIAATTTLRAGDGICFFVHGQLMGTVVNAVRDSAVFPYKMDDITKGLDIFRNHDYAFTTALARAKPKRQIAVQFFIGTSEDRLIIQVSDEDGVETQILTDTTGLAADDAPAHERMRQQFEKTGGTEFTCVEITIGCEETPVLSVAALNALRRDALAKLRAAREETRPKHAYSLEPNSAAYPERVLDFRGNVLNQWAEAFYRRHGVEQIEPAAESGLDLTGRVVMETRYCIRRQLGLCEKAADEAGPLYLVDEKGRRLEVEFECRRCGMRIKTVP